MRADAALLAYVLPSLFWLWLFGMKPLSRNTGISAPVGNRKLMPVTITADDRHLRNLLTTGTDRITRFQEQQLARLYGDLTAVPVSQPRQKFGV
jgi:hypothetical protein